MPRHPRHVAEQTHDPEDFGLGRYETYAVSSPSPMDQERERYAARDATAERVLEMLSDRRPPPGFAFEGQATQLAQELLRATKRPAAVDAQLRKAILFIDPDAASRPSSPTSQGKSLSARRQHDEEIGRSQDVEHMYLLGKADCMAIPAKADFGASFLPITKNQSEVGEADCNSAQGFAGWFYILHMGAPNIGEGSHAEDFMTYAKEDSATGALRLDEERYLSDNRRLWRNAISAMCRLGVDEGVVFPLGMGAFLRKLNTIDETYRDYDKMRGLRRKIADQLMSVLVEFYGSNNRVSGGQDDGMRPRRIHLCLAIATDVGETVHNHNVFVEAASEMLEVFPELPSMLRLHRNQDLLQISHDLAEKCTSPLKVAALNGANRKLFGNHWFADGASLAIDENLHRRSASMSRAALLLNQGVAPRERRPNELADTVKAMGGKVIDLTKDSAAGSQSASPKASGSGMFGCCKKRNPGAAKSATIPAAAGGQPGSGGSLPQKAKATNGATTPPARTAEATNAAAPPPKATKAAAGRRDDRV